jgi:hypothetical protein
VRARRRVDLGVRKWRRKRRRSGERDERKEEGGGLSLLLSQSMAGWQ